MRTSCTPGVCGPNQWRGQPINAAKPATLCGPGSRRRVRAMSEIAPTRAHAVATTFAGARRPSQVREHLAEVRRIPSATWRAAMEPRRCQRRSNAQDRRRVGSIRMLGGSSHVTKSKPTRGIRGFLSFMRHHRARLCSPPDDLALTREPRMTASRMQHVHRCGSSGAAPCWAASVNNRSRVGSVGGVRAQPLVLLVN